MGERKPFRITNPRVTSRAGQRESFRIAITVPQRKHGAGDMPEPRRNVLDDARKIFESLVKSGRLKKRRLGDD